MRLAALALLALAAPSAMAQDALVVAPEEFHEALNDWTAHRTSQGYAVSVVPPGENVAATVRTAHAASKGALRFVVLVGDADYVPPVMRPTDAIKQWEREPELATDAPLADIDGDDVPDLAIGRIPADSADEARMLLARSIAYENDTDHGTWRRRLNVFAGTGGFGAAEDLALELLMRLFMNRDVPPGVDLNFTYAKENSAFCPPPERLPEVFAERLSEGSLVTAYVGHGAARSLDRLRIGDTRFPILDTRHLERVAVRRGSPLVIFVACSTGFFDGEKDCLAEEILRRPAGPVAIIASSRVSTPYGNGILGTEMVRCLFGDAIDEAPTTGELLLAVKRRLVNDPGEDLARRQLEMMAKSFYEESPSRRAVDRKEHVLLYNLLGDPMLRLARPAAATCSPPRAGILGADIAVACSSPITGKALVEILPRRDRNGQPRAAGRTSEQRAKDYSAANVEVVARAEVDVAKANSPFVVQVAVPADLRPDRYLVRLYIEGENGSALAGGIVRLKAAR